jgi:hypothetical protein
MSNDFDNASSTKDMSQCSARSSNEPVNCITALAAAGPSLLFE